MGTITAQSICDRAALSLFDQTGVRWAASELLEYLSDGQREAVILRPSSNPRNIVMELVAGTKQTIPADGMAFGYCIRNMGANGTTPGRAVREVSRAVLDATRPNWHTETANMETLHWVHDNRDPRTFYVTPPRPDPPGRMELVYWATPVELPNLQATIELGDTYQTPLLYYVLSRALAKDSESGNPQKAASYYEMFRSVMEGKEISADRIHPMQMQDRMRQ